MPRPIVLLVDDDDDVRHMTRVTLGFEGFAVIEAANGLDGIACARESNPDVIVLDVMMPGMGGLDVLRELRADTSIRQVPVVLLTARAGRLAEIEGWEAGAAAYLTKPFTGTALATTLREVLGTIDIGELRSAAQNRLNLAQRFTEHAENLRR